MSVSDLSASTQDYLKGIWALSEWSQEPVTPKLISDQVGLRLSSVSDAVRKLTAQGLLSHTPYGSVELTDDGRAHAVAMVRRHRLLETFLVQVLGYSWDQVHDEAEHLEHAVSDLLMERIDKLLGHPSRDPHGDPIPAADGTVALLEATQLSTLAPPAEVTVERINDDDPTLLQFFAQHGIVLDARLSISAGAPFSDSIEIRVAGSAEPLALGPSACTSLYVSPVEE